MPCGFHVCTSCFASFDAIRPCMYVLCVVSRGNFTSAHGGPDVVRGAMKPDAPPFKTHTHTHTHTFSPPPIAPRTALRHMWKQFNQCPEQTGSLSHTHTHTHIHITYQSHTHTHSSHIHNRRTQSLHMCHTHTHKHTSNTRKSPHFTANAYINI